MGKLRRVAAGLGMGSSHAEGVAAEVHPEHVHKEIKGKTINRRGEPSNPAVFIERPGQKNPTPALKKASELHKLGEEEELPSTEKVETDRQRRISGEERQD